MLSRFLGGIAIILLLGTLYAVGLRLSHLTTDGKVAAFDLDGEGSIASWFSITLLTLCGLVTLLVRALRIAGDCATRERRAWLAFAFLWFAMSLDEGACLHEAFKEVLTRFTGTRIMGDGSIYWAVPYSLLLSGAGMFLGFAARRDRSSLFLLFVAGASYGVAAAGQLEIVFAARPILETWLEESCEMLADLCILLCLTRYARSLAFGVSSRVSDSTVVSELQQVRAKANGGLHAKRKELIGAGSPATQSENSPFQLFQRS